MVKMRKLEFPAIPSDRREAFDISVLHPEASKEWWYINAHLLDDDYNLYALMIAMLKDGRLYGIVSDVKHKEKAIIAMPQVAVAHDPDARRFAAGAANLYQPDPAFFCYDFEIERDNLMLDLEMCANKAPLAVNGDGRITMGLGGTSRYYSLTNASVRGEGRLNTVTTKFRGRAWIDRQWGDWADSDFDRWDWFSIQLEGDTEIMFFVFWKDGRIVRKLGDVYLPNGQTRHGVEFTVSTTATWLSPETGMSWETGWTIRVPEFDAFLTVLADFEDQEVDKVLWEGGTKVKGRWQGREIIGRGFFEARQRNW
ncbi:MAG: hypothetical protein M5R36_22690 [Deltaproteobacteria bacterium]|nr:hypothetical protein [Deltaproteobacteria bacterium]